MTKEELRKLAANPDFISGIYNYCDRWCERCAFSSRCFLYATEKADQDFDDPDVRDLNNAKFWRQLKSIFKDAHELIEQCAEEAGIDLDAIEVDPQKASTDEETNIARRQELSVLARDYAVIVQSWLAKEVRGEEGLRHHALGNTTNSDAEIDAISAVEVIRWYQFFIAAKVFRALLGSADVYTDGDDEENPAQSDSNGSAKIALIAIDRSLNAFRVIRGCLSNTGDSIAPIMATLETLRSGIEDTLPLAREFVRPGFDEVVSDFVS